MSGKSIRVFVTGNSPRSLKKITMFNWSGYSYYGTRNQLKDLKKREDASSQGIYFLFSEKEEGTVKLYIGETEDFINRIEQHARKKDWWTRFIVFQSKDNLLNKAHVKYLEHRFWSLAKETFEITLDNGEQSVSQTKLSEEDAADIKIFEENILYILEGLDISFFSKKKAEGISNITESDLYYVVTNDKEFPAFMARSEDVYILKAGSFLKKDAQESFMRHNSGYYKKWKELMESSKVEVVNDTYVKLLEDIELSSPSLCGSLVKARASNGNTTWKNKATDKTIQDEVA